MKDIIMFEEGRRGSEGLECLTLNKKYFQVFYELQLQLPKYLMKNGYNAIVSVIKQLFTLVH